MYPTVPITVPGAVSVSRSVVVEEEPSFDASRSLARPKSRILTWSSSLTITFDGFKSRWTIPPSCARAMPSASWNATSRTRLVGRRVPATSSLRG
jgi:hypothetical protein